MEWAPDDAGSTLDVTSTPSPLSLGGAPLARQSGRQVAGRDEPRFEDGRVQTVTDSCLQMRQRLSKQSGWGVRWIEPTIPLDLHSEINDL